MNYFHFIIFSPEKALIAEMTAKRHHPAPITFTWITSKPSVGTATAARAYTQSQHARFEEFQGWCLKFQI